MPAILLHTIPTTFTDSCEDIDYKAGYISRVVKPINRLSVKTIIEFLNHIKSDWRVGPDQYRDLAPVQLYISVNKCYKFAKLQVLFNLYPDIFSSA